MFLYGPPGNGKSVMGEGIGRVLGGDIYVPHAIDVDGQVVTMFDPVAHQSHDTREEGSIIRSDSDIDGRWIRVGRPVITVGGELTLEMLDLRYKELSAFYEAPVHLKANGGVLVVDDFGRQRVPARDLLNRWIVPLESRVDYLNLISGRKFQVPFDVMVVFATNLEPRSLADEAFLRRIPYKILAKNPSLDQFSRIFEMNCRRHSLHVRPVDRHAPARQVLRRPQARHARVPPARPHRSGRQPVPISPAPGGADARAHRRGVQHLLPRRHAECGDGRAMTLRPSLSAHACENWSRILVGALFLALTWRLLGDFLVTSRATDLLLLVGEALVVVLTCLRRPASIVDKRPIVRLVTAVSMTSPLLSRPAQIAPIISEATAAMLLGMALLVVVGRQDLAWLQLRHCCPQTAASCKADCIDSCGIRSISVTCSRTFHFLRPIRRPGTSRCC